MSNDTGFLLEVWLKRLALPEAAYALAEVNARTAEVERLKAAPVPEELGGEEIEFDGRPVIAMAPEDVDTLNTAVRALSTENAELRGAMQEFIDRVDRGEVRSRYTYKKFKGLLKAGAEG